MKGSLLNSEGVVAPVPVGIGTIPYILCENYP